MKRREVLALFTTALIIRPLAGAQDVSAIQARSLREAARRDFAAGRFEDAERQFLRALALDPSLDDILLDLAKLHIRGQEWQESENDLQRYLRVHPQSPLALGLAGEVKFREHDLRGAEQYLTQVLAMAPDDGIAHKLLALCYGAENRWEQALPHLERATKLRPLDEEAHYWQGRALLEGGKYQEAIGEFEATLKLRPDYLKAVDNIGLCYDRLAQYNLALEFYRRAIELDRKVRTRYVWPYVNLASLLNHLRRYRETLEILEPVAAWEPRSAAVRYHLGRAHLALSQLDRAEADLLQASSLDPSLALPHYQLAQLYKKQGRTEQALQQLEMFSKLAVPSQGNRALY
jgi:tetratricopeptide (TPR) repeat protein